MTQVFQLYRVQLGEFAKQLLVVIALSILGAGTAQANNSLTVTTLTSSANPAVFGQIVTFTATVAPEGAGTPTGSVTFFDGATSLSVVPLAVGAVATYTTTSLALGSHTITASYNGDGNFNSSTGLLTDNPQSIIQANSFTALTSSANPAVFGQSVTLTATVAGLAPGAGTPSGTVTFEDGGSSIGTASLVNGLATLTTSSLAVGNHALTASYAGDSNFNNSTGALTGNPQSIVKANQTITFTSTAPSAAVVSGSTYSVTGTGGASGNAVTFTIDGTASAVCSISGSSVSFIGAGSCVIDANQQGDNNYNAASQAQQSFTVGKGTQATLTVSATPSSISYNATSALSTSGGSGSGAVNYSVTAGQANCSVTGSTLTGTNVGDCTVTATKLADNNYNTATAAVNLSVAPILSVSGPNPMGSGTITATVSTSPSGCGFTQSQFTTVPPTAAATAPAGVRFVYGLTGMTIAGACGNGSTASFTLQYPNALPANAQLWKYGKTGANTTDHWYQLSAANNVIISGNTVSYSVTDGGLGDDDYTVNGSIVDPVGLGVPYGAAVIPTLSEWSMMMLSALLALGTFIVMRRRQL